jgi:hypothetical protein
VSRRESRVLLNYERLVLRLQRGGQSPAAQTTNHGTSIVLSCLRRPAQYSYSVLTGLRMVDEAEDVAPQPARRGDLSRLMILRTNRTLRLRYLQSLREEPICGMVQPGLTPERTMSGGMRC